MGRLRTFKRLGAHAHRELKSPRDLQKARGGRSDPRLDGLECRGSFLRFTWPPSFEPPCGRDPADTLDLEHVSAGELLGIEEPKVEHGAASEDWIRADATRKRERVITEVSV